jgi:hypothetical protein
MRDQQDALPLVVALPDPLDDDGAEAQANFHFQCEVTARYCYGLFEPDGPVAVVCEYQEDLLVVFRTGLIDLVSVKHRGLNRGPYSVGELCDGGGLTHLFDRWLALRASDRTLRATVVSDAGLSNEAGQPAELAKLCDAERPDPSALRAWSKKLARQFLLVAQRRRTHAIPRRDPPARAELLDDGDSLVLLVGRFINVLTFVPAPRRNDITASSIVDVVMPVCRQQGWDTRDAESTHAAVVALVQKAVRSFGRQRIDLARRVASMDRWPTGVERDERLAARLIDVELLRTAIVRGGDIPLFPPGRTPLPAPGGATLRQKMASGQLPTTHHHFAERLRSAWYTLRRSVLPDLPGDAALLAQVETEVCELVIDAQESIAPGGDGYGRTLYQALRDGVRVSAFRQRPPLTMNDQHALGVAFELCDQCTFDFLPPVTVDGGRVMRGE